MCEERYNQGNIANMTNFILYITEQFYSYLSPEHLQGIQSSCLLEGFSLIVLKENSILKKNETNHLILASSLCLLSLLKDESFQLKSNVIIFGSCGKELEQYKNRVKEIRFILGEPQTPLFEIFLTHTLKFFKNQIPQNICNVFKTESASFLSCELKNSKERNDVQIKISEFFQSQIEKNKDKLTTGASIYAKNLSDVLEEFLMNAIWDANPKYNLIDRSQTIELKEEERINIFCLFDGTNLIISVTDLFGSFTPGAIEKHIQFLLKVEEKHTINEASAGAGIGLLMILKKIGILIFEVEKGKTTRATAIARGDQPFRDMQKNPRTLLFYEK